MVIFLGSKVVLVSEGQCKAVNYLKLSIQCRSASQKNQRTPYKCIRLFSVGTVVIMHIYRKKFSYKGEASTGIVCNFRQSNHWVALLQDLEYRQPLHIKRYISQNVACARLTPLKEVKNERRRYYCNKNIIIVYYYCSELYLSLNTIFDQYQLDPLAP